MENVDNMRIKLAAAAAVLTLINASCTKNGTISASGQSSVSGSMTTTAVYPSNSGESWSPIKLGSRYYIKGLDVTVKGTCTRGIASIKVGESGVGGAYYSETATCLNDGSFTWNKSYTGSVDADKTLTIVAFDVDDALIADATTTVDVHVDNVAPAAPVVTTPASTPYTHNGATSTFTVIGTCAADTDHLTRGTLTIANSGTSWQNDETLVPGSSVTFTYYAWDLAGNQSAGTPQRIDWSPSLSLLVGNTVSGANVTDGGTSFSMESSLESNDGTNTHGSSSFKLDYGFNFLTNSARQ